jgi:hypothetical protein
MDEIDGMSAGDRGGVSALKKVISTTKVSQSSFLIKRFPSFASATTEDIKSSNL